MQWFGILALLFLLFALAGFVYIGANTDKLGFGFGEPSEISKQITTPITESIASPSTSDSSQSNSKNDSIKIDTLVVFLIFLFNHSFQNIWGFMRGAL